MGSRSSQGYGERDGAAQFTCYSEQSCFSTKISECPGYNVKFLIHLESKRLQTMPCRSSNVEHADMMLVYGFCNSSISRLQGCVLHSYKKVIRSDECSNFPRAGRHDLRRPGHQSPASKNDEGTSIFIGIPPSESLVTVLRTPDTLSVAREAIEDILRVTLAPGCSVIFITDDSSHYMTIQKFSKNFGGSVAIGVLEVSRNNEEKTISAQFERLIEHLKKLQELTGCTTILISTDDKELLGLILQELFRKGRIAWPRKLLVVTGIPVTGLAFVKEPLSNSNSVIVSPSGTGGAGRCLLYVLVPYSHRVLKVASWKPNAGFAFYDDYRRLFPNKFDRLVDRAELRVASGHYLPHVNIEILQESAKEEDEVFTISGPMITLLEYFASTMNFNYTIRRPPGGSWGYVLPNMTATGMVGQLARKEVDIALGPFGITENRIPVMDYTIILLVDYVTIIARLGNIEVDVWGFVMPWDSSVWVSIVITFFGILFVVTALSLVIGDQRNTKYFGYLKILLQQVYSGNLMSLLAVRYIPQPYQVIEDVLRDRKIGMIWESNTAYIQTYMSATTGKLAALGAADRAGRIQHVNAQMLPEKLATSVFKGDYVMNIEVLTCTIMLAEHFSKTGNCYFYIAKERLMPFMFAIGAQKNSPLKDDLNRRIRSVVEGGIYMQLIKSAIPNSTRCLHAPTTVTVRSSLSMSNLWGIFMILVMGTSTGLMALFTEILRKVIIGCMNGRMMTDRNK
ncbi:uncharacterized protein [Macrobrachium rosenbergii]|uniref:uncharacterized protein n=1 Tax=Macrobrachium rosenbergii TaxID=79674 RepID=UPI0034D44E1D